MLAHHLEAQVAENSSKRSTGAGSHAARSTTEPQVATVLAMEPPARDQREASSLTASQSAQSLVVGFLQAWWWLLTATLALGGSAVALYNTKADLQSLTALDEKVRGLDQKVRDLSQALDGLGTQLQGDRVQLGEVGKQLRAIESSAAEMKGKLDATLTVLVAKEKHK